MSTTDERINTMKDSLLVLSGGLDSVTLLHDERGRIALAATFDYGANHAEREIAAARRNAERLGIPHIVIPLAFIKDHFRSSLLAGASAVPEGHYAAENMKSTVVPFRNGIMLAIAAGIAESRGLSRILIASHAGDHAIYPDCRPGFVAAMGEAVRQGTWAGIQFAAPFEAMSKADIVRRGAEVGVDFADTYSCYKGGERHCGKCGTCVERREAFALAGIPDPTLYEE